MITQLCLKTVPNGGTTVHNPRSTNGVIILTLVTGGFIVKSPGGLDKIRIRCVHIRNIGVMMKVICPPFHRAIRGKCMLVR